MPASDTLVADTDGEGETPSAEADTETDPDVVEDADPRDVTDAESEQGPEGLAACPNPLVIQTDWFPEPEHGALYQLTAGVGLVDAETGRFRGPLAADPSLTIEIRAGGPYVGFEFNPFVMRDDESIFLAYVDTNAQIIGADLGVPTLAVVAPLEKNPQILMWDPATYDFEPFADIGESGAVVHLFGYPNWAEYLVFTGQLSQDQIDESYDGSPDRFIESDGAIVQQGFAMVDPTAANAAILQAVQDLTRSGASAPRGSPTPSWSWTSWGWSATARTTPSATSTWTGSRVSST